VPLTPSTVTSWGPSEIWPPSPEEEFRVPTPDISARCIEDDIEPYQPSQFVWPFLSDMEDISDAPTSSQNKVEDYEEQTIETPTSAREQPAFTTVWALFDISTTFGFPENLAGPKRRESFIYATVTCFLPGKLATINTA